MSEELEQPSEPKSAVEPSPQPAARSSFKKVLKSILLLLLLGLIAAAFIMTSAYTVPAGHQAVVLRFGRYAGTADPGIRFRLPFGIDRIADLETGKVLIENFGFRDMNPGVRTGHARDAASLAESSMLTGDLSEVLVEWSVQYRCSDPEKFLFAFHDRSQAIHDAGEESMRAAVGGASLDYVIQNREELGRACRDRLQADLDSLGSGIAVTAVVIQDINPPDPLKAAFDEVNAAQQERDRLVQEAMADYNREMPKARGEAKGMVSSAEGYALESVNKARGEASRFNDLLGEYRKAREVTKRRLYLETCREVMPKARQVIVVDGRYKDILPKLDLNKGTPPAGGGR
jgi:modulator of FtsH protease HflK